MDAPLDVKAIRARADACFVAPWVATNFAVECGHPVGEGEDCSRCAGEGETEVERIESPNEYPDGGQVVADVPGLEMFSKPHAAFIAAARTDVPALCDEVVRLKAERDELELLLAQCADWMNSNPSTRFGKAARDENVERHRLVTSARAAIAKVRAATKQPQEVK
jgi:hypothetical protein